MTRQEETNGLLDANAQPQRYHATTNNKNGPPSIVVTSASSDSIEVERRKNINKILNGVNIYTILVG
jgi:hypothetical protein